MTSARWAICVAAVLGLLASACAGAPAAPARTGIDSMTPYATAAPSPAGVAEDDWLRMSLWVSPTVAVGAPLTVTLEVSNVGSQRIAFGDACNPRLTVEVPLPVAAAGKTWTGRMARAKEYILGAPGRDTNAYPLYYKDPYDIRFDWGPCTYPDYTVDGEQFVPNDADKVGVRNWAVPLVLAPGESITLSTTRVARLLPGVLVPAGLASVVGVAEYVPQDASDGTDGIASLDPGSTTRRLISVTDVAPMLSVQAPVEFTGTGPRLLSAGEAVDAALHDARFAAWVSAHPPEKWSISNLSLDTLFEGWDVELFVNPDVYVIVFVDPISGSVTRFCQDLHCTKWSGGT